MAVALVTGAARRVGAAIARHLANEGHKVILHARKDDENLQATLAVIQADGNDASMVLADLADRDAVADLILRASEIAGAPIDLLVNNASTFENDDLWTATHDSWDFHMKVNLEAPFFLSQQFAAALPPENAGLIVNIIDQRVWKLNPTFMTYTVSKSALWTLTQTMAQALAPRIRVNAIGPGPVFTSIHQTDDSFAAEAGNVPLGKGPDAKEIARAVSFLLETPSMTGQMMALDGGQHLAWQTPDLTSQE